MNLVGRTSGDLLYANFNQDNSCISVGTRKGFIIYNCSPFNKVYSWLDGGISIADMLFCTSLVAVVGSGEQPQMSPRRLQLLNTSSSPSSTSNPDSKAVMICDLNFVTSVLAVKLNMKRLIVVLETKIYIYDIAHMKLLETLSTDSNQKAICAFSSNDNSLLAYPAGSKGQVVLYDALNLHPLNSVLDAHKSPLAAMCFNYDGTLLATASDQGTIVRVFRVQTGAKIAQFRRGAYSTVHIFKMGQQTPSPVQLVSSTVTPYLPTAVTDMIEPQRDFAQIKIGRSNVPNICAINSSNSLVMVLTADGFCNEYMLDVSQGGECRLIREHRLGAEIQDDMPSAELHGQMPSLKTPLDPIPLVMKTTPTQPKAPLFDTKPVKDHFRAPEPPRMSDEDSYLGQSEYMSKSETS